MKEKILMLLTMFSIICLSSFTPSKESNHNTTNAVKKTSPTVTITYPSEFTKFIELQQKKAIERTKPITNKVGPYSTLFWWDFSGSQSQQNDPGWYSKDSDNFPDCTNVTGTTRCEIRAEGNAYDDTVPELTSIVSIRYRPQ
jgi:hypothetical protein